MHRIDTSTAQKDKFGAGKNGFTGGNPQTGELPTALNADFFDSVQEEIAAVIEAAGLTLIKSNRAQLLAAMNTLIGPGRLLNIQVLTGSGNYIPTPGTKKILGEAVGAGGGGGGASAGGTSGSNYIISVGGGGGAGAYAKFIMDSGFANLAYTCGKGGLGGNKTGSPNAQGVAGGQTTFGAQISVPGGAGGSSGTTNDAFSTGCAAGGGFGANAPTLASAIKSILSMGGSVGAPGYMINANGGNAGVGANSMVGYGGFGASNGPGGEGRGYGSGGGGALTIYSNTTTMAGGNGGDGLILIWEYA